MKVLKKYRDALITFTLVFSLLFVVSRLQTTYDSNVIMHLYGTIEKNTDKYILPAFIVKNFSFGFNAVLADAYWVTAIQDFSSWDRTADFYYREYENISTLDPTFAYPYLFGILVTASKKYPDSVNKMEPIAQVGIDNLPYNWEIPFYLGSQFNLLKSFPKALHYMTIAAYRPIVPRPILQAYESFLKKKSVDNETTRSVMKAMYDTTDSKKNKQIIRTGLITEELNSVLKDPLSKYKTKNGVYPSTINDLIKANLIQVSPTILKDYTITIDTLTGQVTITPKSDLSK